MNKSSTIFVSLLLTLICISGCNNNKEPNTTGRDEFANHPFSMTSQLSFRLSKEQIQSTLGIPDIVRNQKDNSYEIREVSDGSKIITFYNGNIVSDSWRLTRLLKRNEFENITIGKDTSDE